MMLFSYFSQKTGFDISCKLSPKETICMKWNIIWEFNLYSVHTKWPLEFFIGRFCAHYKRSLSVTMLPGYVKNLLLIDWSQTERCGGGGMVREYVCVWGGGGGGGVRAGWERKRCRYPEFTESGVRFFSASSICAFKGKISMIYLPFLEIIHENVKMN